ncbi:MAG: Fe(3+) ABC transporter substrate-binding protein [Hyphomicrobiaceae bacterium]|nr:Fe(3+) ABC transporter substrate-binding protein [Hyphomicrobiaceae bacterium]
MSRIILALGALAGIVAGILTGPAFADGVVNIYSYREPELFVPLLHAFTAETGIETRILNFSDGMLERVKAEGRNSPADVFLTTDIGRLIELRDGGVTQPVVSDELQANIPPAYRDPGNEWFGLTMRARVVYASKDRVPDTEITYEDLADPKWRSRVCTRSGQHHYNTALFASMIAHHGEDYTQTWLEGLKANLAHPPTGNDRQQAQAIYAGECDIALGNTYYVGLMMTNEEEPEQKDWAAAIKVIFPNANDRGTHVNISGMAMAKNSPNPDNARKLLEFLASPEAQSIYANQVFEYPLSPDATTNDIVKSFGTLNPDTLPLEDIAKYRDLASELVDRVGFDN